MPHHVVKYFAGVMMFLINLSLKNSLGDRCTDLNNNKTDSTLVSARHLEVSLHIPQDKSNKMRESTYWD